MKTPPYSVNWNTKKLSGSYTLTAVAYDATGNLAVSEAVAVTIVQPVKSVPPGRKE